MFNSKISLNTIERFSILTIDNKYTRSVQSLFRASINNIDIPSSFFCQGMKILDNNDKNNKSEIELEIKLEDKMNQNILICQTDRASSQHQQNLIPTITLYILSYA